MIIENEAHSVLQDKHNLSFIAHIINFHGDKSLILNSLQKIKSNTLCKIKREKISKWIKEYTQHIENDDFHLKPESYKLSPAYARQSYHKVLKEDEYLQKLISILDPE